MCDGQVMQVVASRSTYKGSPERFTQINKVLCRGDIIGKQLMDEQYGTVEIPVINTATMTYSCERITW